MPHIKRSKYLIGSNARRLWFNDDDQDVYIELGEGATTEDMKLKVYLSQSLSEEVESLWKLVIKNQMNLPDLLESLVKQSGGDETAQASARECVNEKDFKELAFKLKNAQIHKRMQTL